MSLRELELGHCGDVSRLSTLPGVQLSIVLEVPKENVVKSFVLPQWSSDMQGAASTFIFLKVHWLFFLRNMKKNYF